MRAYVQYVPCPTQLHVELSLFPATLVVESTTTIAATLLLVVTISSLSLIIAGACRNHRFGVEHRIFAIDDRNNRVTINIDLDICSVAVHVLF